MSRGLAFGSALLLGAAAAWALQAVVGDAQAQSAPRIAYIDVQRVLARSAAGVAAREQLEREKVAMQKDVDDRRAEVQKLREEIDKRGPLLSADARKEKQDTLERKIRDLRRLADDYRMELEKREQELGREILVGISGIVERLGKQKGYLLILERRNAGVIYGSPEADLTDEIIRAYDRESARTKKK